MSACESKNRNPKFLIRFFLDSSNTSNELAHTFFTKCAFGDEIEGTHNTSLLSIAGELVAVTVENPNQKLTDPPKIPTLLIYQNESITQALLVNREEKDNVMLKLSITDSFSLKKINLSSLKANSLNLEYLNTLSIPIGSTCVVALPTKLTEFELVEISEVLEYLVDVLMRRWDVAVAQANLGSFSF